MKHSDNGFENLTPPRHVAIIMDGNGRWAKERGLPRTLGHRQGVEAVRRAVRAAMELKITYLTIFSFSSENWKRPAEEVDDLMGLMKRFIRRDLAELHEAGVCIRIIGERQQVDSELMTLIDEAVELTRGNDKLTLVIAFNYGSRGELARAARRLAEQVAAGQIDPSEITVERMANALDTSGHPAKCGCRILCCGRPLTRNSFFSIAIGPISTRRLSKEQSASSAPVSAASAV
jgi:undecaprenyl diphosphate synthase